MTANDLVNQPDQVLENIRRYQTEIRDLRDGQELIRRMRMVHVWHAVKPDAGPWLFAPSKFVGHAKNSARHYLAGAEKGDGRQTEHVLR